MTRSAAAAICLAGCLPPCAAAAQARAGGAAAPQVVLENPIARIGVADGDPAYLLFGARGAARLSSGELVVANMGSNQIRIYDARGVHVRTFGRAGDGPGEFRGLQHVGVIRGDTIVAYDVHLGRISYFTRDGERARTLQLQPFGNGVLPRAHGFTLDGRMLGRTDFDRVFRSGTSRDTLVFALFDADGAPRDTLGAYPGTEMFVLATPQTALRREVVFGRGVFASARGSFAVIGTNDALHYDVFAASGARMRTHTAAHTPRRVQPAEVRRADADWIAGLPAFIRGDIEKRIGEFPHGDTYPAYSSLLVGTDGSVWLQAQPVPGSADRSWTVFSMDGRRIRDVRAHVPLELLDAGRDWVIGWMRDDLGVERVALYVIPPAA